MRIILDGSVSTVKRLRVLLGTLVALEATVEFESAVGPGNAASAAETAAAAIEQAFAAIEDVNRLMHPWANGSDLARINNASLHASTRVHPSVRQLLGLAKQINTLTEGVFDPCTPTQLGRLGDIELSADETVVICHAPVALDFGGFAKGYAVDCAVEALMAAGCTAGLVNAGGDLRVFGVRVEPVFVRGPGGELTPIELVNSALAVSDARNGQRPPEHQGYYVRSHGAVAAASQHVSGERAAAPDEAPIALATTYAAVIAEKAVIADALAKCVLLCTPAVAEHTLRAFNATQQPR
jgi:FAD:protein FMN transferase